MTTVAAIQSDIALRCNRRLRAMRLLVRTVPMLAVAAFASLGLRPASTWAQDAVAEPESRPGPSPASAHERQALEQNLEEKVQSMLDKVIGSGRSVVRISAELHPATTAQRGQSIARLSIALTVDETKVVIDPKTHMIYEAIRPAGEIEEYMHLVQAAAGFNAARGDTITVRALSFDKTQAIQAREMSVSNERRIFWTRLAGWITLAAGLILFSLWMRHSSGPGVFANDTITRSALALSIGLFFCLLAVDFWEDGLSLQAVSSIPGVFLLIVGAGRLSGHLLPGTRDV